LNSSVGLAGASRRHRQPVNVYVIDTEQFSDGASSSDDRFETYAPNESLVAATRDRL
jgi:hypothetical protein